MGAGGGAAEAPLVSCRYDIISLCCRHAALSPRHYAAAADAAICHADILRYMLLLLLPYHIRWPLLMLRVATIRYCHAASCYFAGDIYYE